MGEERELRNREDVINENSGELNEAALESVAGGGNLVPAATLTLTAPIAPPTVSTPEITTTSSPSSNKGWDLTKNTAG
jgi:hypothetical protein